MLGVMMSLPLLSLLLCGGIAPAAQPAEQSGTEEGSGLAPDQLPPWLRDQETPDERYSRQKKQMREQVEDYRQSCQQEITRLQKQLADEQREHNRIVKQLQERVQKLAQGMQGRGARTP